MFRSAAVLLLVSLATFTANAALLPRLPLDPYSDLEPFDPDEYQAWYDTRLNITWLDDANYANTSDFATDGGKMTWVESQAWIATLNASNFLGVNTWRLPNALPVDEMEDLYFNTLGGTLSPSCTPASNCTLPTTAPFYDVHYFDYWTGTLQFGGAFAADWYWGGGYAGNGNVNTSRKYVWLVTDGDIATIVPVPAAYWLFGSGVLVLGGFRRRQAVG